MSDAAGFVERFSAYWRAPSVAGLDSLLAADVRLVTPMAPATSTLAEGKRAFAALFAIAPDLTAEVHRWGATADGVLIEFTLSGTAAGRPISWHAVDRFVIDADGLASERVSYFDSAPLALAMVRRPRTWLPILRARRGAGSRAST
jgi:ketosteroid isomerase-like protein